MKKGLKYNLPLVGDKGLFNEIINSECTIKAIPDDGIKNFIRVKVAKKIGNRKHKMVLFPAQNRDYLALSRIKDKLTSNETVLCKADKGSTTVILYKGDYICNLIIKLNNFICKN